MITRFLAVLIPLATTWPVTAAHGQLADTVLQPGRTIRLVAPELGIRRGSGTLVDIRGDTLVLGVRGLIPEPGESFRLSLVEQLDVSIGRKSHAAYGAVIGAVLGAVAGMFLFSQDCESAVEGEACSTFRATAVIATGAGGLAGWLAGGMIKPHRWAPVALTPYSVGRVAQAP